MGKVRSILTGEEIETADTSDTEALNSALIALLAKEREKTLSEVQAMIDLANERARAAEAECATAKALQASAEKTAQEVQKANDSLQTLLANERAERKTEKENDASELATERQRFSSLSAQLDTATKSIADLKSKLQSQGKLSQQILTTLSTEDEPAPVSYRFTPKRNELGLIVDVVAEPIGG